MKIADHLAKTVSRADKKRKYSAKWYHKYRSKAVRDDAKNEAKDAENEKWLNDFRAIIDSMKSDINQVRYDRFITPLDARLAEINNRRKARFDAQQARYAAIDTKYTAKHAAKFLLSQTYRDYQGLLNHHEHQELMAQLNHLGLLDNPELLDHLDYQGFKMLIAQKP
jgi:hypothetical protein